VPMLPRNMTTAPRNSPRNKDVTQKGHAEERRRQRCCSPAGGGRSAATGWERDGRGIVT